MGDMQREFIPVFQWSEVPFAYRFSISLTEQLAITPVVVKNKIQNSDRVPCKVLSNLARAIFWILLPVFSAKGAGFTSSQSRYPLCYSLPGWFSFLKHPLPLSPIAA